MMKMKEMMKYIQLTFHILSNFTSSTAKKSKSKIINSERKTEIS